MLVKCFHKFEGGVLKTINLRMCKLTNECLQILSEIIPYLQSVVLSSNNFGGSSGLKALAESIDSAKGDFYKIIYGFMIIYCLSR